MSLREILNHRRAVRHFDPTKPLDNSGVGRAGKPNTNKIAEHRDGMELSFFQLDDPLLAQIRDEILELDVNNLTPVEALNKLNDIKKLLKGK